MTTAKSFAGDLQAETFLWPVRVYWEDTDAGGVVYHANYLKFLERARSEWLRSLAIDQNELRRREGVILVVCHLECEFLAAARLDDELRVSVELQASAGVSMTMAQEIHRDGDGRLLIRARVKTACLNAERWTPCRFPRELKRALSYNGHDCH